MNSRKSDKKNKKNKKNKGIIRVNVSNNDIKCADNNCIKELNMRDQIVENKLVFMVSTNTFINTKIEKIKSSGEIELTKKFVLNQDADPKITIDLNSVENVQILDNTNTLKINKKKPDSGSIYIKSKDNKFLIAIKKILDGKVPLNDGQNKNTPPNSSNGGQIKNTPPNPSNDGQNKNTPPNYSNDGQNKNLPPNTSNDGQNKNLPPNTSNDGQNKNTIPDDGQIKNTKPADGQIKNTIPADGQIKNTLPADGQIKNTIPDDGPIKNTKPADGQTKNTQPNPSNSTPVIEIPISQPKKESISVVDPVVKMFDPKNMNQHTDGSDSCTYDPVYFYKGDLKSLNIQQDKNALGPFKIKDDQFQKSAKQINFELITGNQGTAVDITTNILKESNMSAAYFPFIQIKEILSSAITSDKGIQIFYLLIKARNDEVYSIEFREVKKMEALNHLLDLIKLRLEEYMTVFRLKLETFNKSGEALIKSIKNHEEVKNKNENEILALKLEIENLKKEEEKVVSDLKLLEKQEEDIIKQTDNTKNIEQLNKLKQEETNIKNNISKVDDKISKIQKEIPSINSKIKITDETLKNISENYKKQFDDFIKVSQLTPENCIDKLNQNQNSK